MSSRILHNFFYHIQAYPSARIFCDLSICGKSGVENKTLDFLCRVFLIRLPKESPLLSSCPDFFLIQPSAVITDRNAKFPYRTSHRKGNFPFSAFSGFYPLLR